MYGWFCFSDDHSRVVLDVVDGDIHSDYINADYVHVSVLKNNNRNYCKHACQAEKPSIGSCQQL